MKPSVLPLFIAAILSSTTVLAAQPSYYYFTENIGIFQGVMNQSYLDNSDAIAQNIAQPVNQQGYTVGIAAGYRQSWRDAYFLGWELSGNIDTQKASFKSGAYSTAFSDATNIQAHTDLTFVPGINLSTTIASYLKLGVSLASIYDKLNSPVGVFASSTTYHSHKYRLGFAAGLGVSKAISNTLSIFTEVNYHDYGSVDFSGFQNFTADYSHSAHIYSYGAVIGMSYQFA